MAASALTSSVLRIFEIRFPGYSKHPVCRPNETLQGVVVLKLERDLSASAVLINVKGEETVIICKNNMSKTVYFDERFLALETDAGVIPAGTHLLHFSCCFPCVNLPANASTPEFEVSYFIRAAILNKSGGILLDMVTKKVEVEFRPVVFADTALRGLQLPQSMQFEHVLYESKESLVATSMERQAPSAPKAASNALLRVVGSMPKQYYFPGEHMNISLSLSALNKHAVRKGHLLVQERTQCVVHERVCWEKARTLHKDTVAIQQNGTAAFVRFQLPEEGLQAHDSMFLRYTYAAQCVFHLSGGLFSKKVKLRVPFRIATKSFSEFRGVRTTPPSIYDAKVASISIAPKLESTSFVCGGSMNGSPTAFTTSIISNSSVVSSTSSTSSSSSPPSPPSPSSPPPSNLFSRVLEEEEEEEEKDRAGALGTNVKSAFTLAL